MSATDDDSPRPVKRRRLDAEDAARLSTIVVSVDNADIDTPAKQDDTPRQLRSSARQRRPPQRFEQQSSTPTRQGPNRARQTTSTSRGSTPGTSQVEIALQNDTSDASRVVTTSPLKGILTPSRKNRTQSRPRKTVVFDNDEAEIEQRLGFKNLDRSVKKPKAVPSVPTPKLREKNIDLTSVEDTGGIEEEIVVQTESPQDDAEQANYYHGRIARLNGTDRVDDVPSQFSTARATVLRRLTGVCSTHLPVPTHLRQAYKTLHSLLTATVSTSESNSLLLLGPRGAGKSMLLEQAVSDLTRQHGHDSFYTVRLSGFLQTDDRLALREIWRQLGKELTAVNGEEDHIQDTTSSYADVMTSLLTLLSHPDEQLIEDENGAVRTHGEGRVAKSTIFILDEFDLFTTHPRQTLLYNLFDIAQSRKAPIAVIGCSSRMDVVDGLEKRVKSRFSQRWVFVPPPRSLGDWDDVVRSVLRTSTGRAEIDLMTMSQEEQQSVEQWDGFIDKTLLSSTAVQNLSRRYFYNTKALPDFFTALYPIVAGLDPSSPQNPGLQANTTFTPPSLLDNLKLLPSLPISLLISHCRLETIHCLPATNFNLVYAHYTELVTRARTQQSAAGAISVSGSLRIWGRDVAKRAWQELSDSGFLVSAHGGESVGDGVGAGAGMEIEDTRMWRSEVALDDVEWALKTREGAVSSVLSKWCREI